jgi:hypothetical protein
LLKELQKNKSYIEKTAHDFSLALEHCYNNSTAPYIALFEDDIIVARGWFAKIQFAIHEAESLAAKQQHRWLDLRLFNDAKEIRWSAGAYGPSFPFVAIYIPMWSILLAGMAYLLLCQLRKSSAGSRMFSEQAIHTICLVTIPVFVVLFFRTGYMSTMSRADGVSIQPWGCCTQGEIFPRSEIPGLITQLRKRAKTTPADITVWLYAREQRLLRMVLDPPVIQHLGFSSVLAPERKKTKNVWSVAFEDLDEARLMDQHARIVEELYE